MSAFEIRFSTTDSRLEILEIQPDHKSKENVPDPFKKRDKIPRSSGNIEFTNDSYSNSNSNSSISNNSSNSSSNHSNSNTAVPARHSSTDSQAPIRSRHHPNGDNVNGRMSSNSDQVSSLKVKSSNSVGPEADKQLQRLSGGKNLNIERSNSLNNDVNALEEDSIIRNAQSSNKKQRSIKVDEFTGEKEKVNSGKVIPNHQIMDLNGKTEIGISNKIMAKTIIKNKKISMLNNNKDDENKPIPKDGIATPPDTPPRSPARSPQAPSTIRQTRSDNDITDQITLEQTQLATPPPSSSSINSNEDISTQSSSRVTQQPIASRKRRGSHSSQFSSEMPAAKLQTPRSRRLSSATSRPTVAAEPQEPFTIQLTNKSKEMQKSQQSQQTPPRSRIPRLSISSKERPVIPKKESQGSLSLSSQGSNRFNDSKESLSQGAKLQTPRELRSATSRPIINTSFVTDLDVESESPTSYSPSHSPTSYSSASRSPTNQSPTSSHSVQQKKLTISHDDVIVPTVAKKLKMNGQLHFVNHDALLGYSEEPENISPSTENGYMDITDQVVDLFDNPRKKSHKKKSIPDSQRRPQQSVRKNSHTRNSSKTYYIAPRKQNHQPAQQTYEDSSSPIVTQPENSSNPSTFNDNDRKSRREEYIMVIHDDDIEFIESSSTSSDPSEPITAPAVQVENNDQIYQNNQMYQNNQIYQNNETYQNNDQIYQEKIVEPEPVQEPIVQYNQYDQYDQSNQYNPSPVEKTSAPIAATNAKIKKEKKRKQKKESAVLDDDESVRGSCLCRCTIQ